MNGIKSINESFSRLSKNILDEAKISPEDEYDSQILRNIYKKMWRNGGEGRKRFSAEEKAVMDKYDLDFSKTGRKRDNQGLITSDGYSLNNPPIDRFNKHGGPAYVDKVNVADRARKRKERNKDWEYRKNTTRATHDKMNTRGEWGNPAQSWARAYDDEKMKKDYKNKYKDLYDKKDELHYWSKRSLDFINRDIERYKSFLRDAENKRDLAQQKYDKDKAEFKDMIAKRRSKKNESLRRSRYLESYTPVYERSKYMSELPNGDIAEIEIIRIDDYDNRVDIYIDHPDFGEPQYVRADLDQLEKYLSENNFEEVSW